MSRENLDRFINDMRALPVGAVVKVWWPSRLGERSNFIYVLKETLDHVRELTGDVPWRLIKTAGWADDLWVEYLPEDEQARLLAVSAMAPDQIEDGNRAEP